MDSANSFISRATLSLQHDTLLQKPYIVGFHTIQFFVYAVIISLEEACSRDFCARTL